jgi:hypothetical protein
MANAIWQSKRVIKTAKDWQKPSWIGNRPKGMSKEDWEIQVKEWKFDKLVVLDKVPKTSKKEFAPKDKSDE